MTLGFLHAHREIERERERECARESESESAIVYSNLRPPATGHRRYSERERESNFQISKII